MTVVDPLGREDCTCQQFVDAEGADRHWLIGPRHALCTCGHSAAWHDEDTGRCWFPTPAAKRARAAIVQAYGEPEPEALAYWEQVLAGERPTGKPSMADITKWNEQTRTMFMAADVAGLYGDQGLAEQCSQLAQRIIDIAAEAVRPKDGTEA